VKKKRQRYQENNPERHEMPSSGGQAYGESLQMAHTGERYEMAPSSGIGTYAESVQKLRAAERHELGPSTVSSYRGSVPKVYEMQS